MSQQTPLRKSHIFRFDCVSHLSAVTLHHSTPELHINTIKTQCFLSIFEMAAASKQTCESYLRTHVGKNESGEKTKVSVIFQGFCFT